MRDVFSIRLSKADRRVIEKAAKYTGRSPGEYIRELSVLCAIRLVRDIFGEDRLSVEHRARLHRFDDDPLAVQDALEQDQLELAGGWHGLRRRKAQRVRQTA